MASDLPVEVPGELIRAGLNYRDHAEESGLTPPGSPVFFGRWPSSLIPHGSEIVVGTPGGAGMARRPALRLGPGRVVEVETEGTGELRDSVIGAS